MKSNKYVKRVVVCGAMIGYTQDEKMWHWSRIFEANQLRFFLNIWVIAFNIVIENMMIVIDRKEKAVIISAAMEDKTDDNRYSRKKG